MTDNSEIADLRRELEALKRAVQPPAPFTPQPHQRFDPTASMSMPRSAMEAMVNAVPDHVMRDIVAKGTIPGPCGAGASGQVAKVSSSPGLPGTTNGWREAAPIGPPPGVALADRLMDEADRRDRIELAERLAKTQRVEAAMRKVIAETK
jgi:hypothetical protein